MNIKKSLRRVLVSLGLKADHPGGTHLKWLVATSCLIHKPTKSFSIGAKHE
jgi:hypothetical protein